MGDLKCPECGNNSFQARADDQRAVTFICVACWKELRLEELTRDQKRALHER
jgi:predicted  nucleic acid-binding Zn-ribbon protein